MSAIMTEVAAAQPEIWSEFISNNELPELLNTAEEKGLNIFWLAVRPSTVDDTEIAKCRAVHEEPPPASIEERDFQYVRIPEGHG